MLRRASILLAALLVSGAALAQSKLPPLRTGVDGTFAPHAMPKLGGGVEGFQIDLFTEVARRMLLRCRRQRGFGCGLGDQRRQISRPS